MIIFWVLLTLTVLTIILLCSELKHDPSVPGEWISSIVLMIVVFAACWIYS